MFPSLGPLSAWWEGQVFRQKAAGITFAQGITRSSKFATFFVWWEGSSCSTKVSSNVKNCLKFSLFLDPNKPGASCVELCNFRYYLALIISQICFSSFKSREVLILKLHFLAFYKFSQWDERGDPSSLSKKIHFWNSINLPFLSSKMIRIISNM